MRFGGFAATLAALRNFRITAWGRYGAAAIAGLCLALAFPNRGVTGLAWLAPALMLASALGACGWERFRVGYIAGLAHYLASLSWLLQIPVTGFPILGWVALSAFLALFPATWVWLTLGVSGFRFQVSGSNSPGATDQGNWAQRCTWALAGAAAWVAMEMILARIFGGFPWNFVGASQYRLLPLIQVASITGVYGVSFLVVWFSLALFSAAAAIYRQPANRYAWASEIILPATVLSVVFVSGLRTLRETAATDDSRRLRVTFIQPSIPQTLIWDTNENSNRFRQLLDLTALALTNETDLVLWPEAAVPNMVRYDEATRLAVTGLARSNRVWMIVGSDDAALRPGGTTEEDVDYFNASFLINPDGEIAASYRKNHLVMFGEFIPLARWLPFVKWFTPITGGFTPGTKPIPFELEGPSPTTRMVDAVPRGAEPEVGAPVHVKSTTLICFEDVFPHLVRRYVEDDTDFLVNLTNDGWFGESSAQWQHAATAVFRAVENGLPLLRCCNNGLTCWVDEHGRIREILRDADGHIYGPGFLHATVPLRHSELRAPATFYTRHGDWFGWSCVGLTALQVATRCRRGNARGTPEG